MKARLFLGVAFLNEEELIQTLPLIEKKIGKYDYFTQNISLDASVYGPGFRARLFSFPLLLETEKLAAQVSKLRKHFASNDTFEIYLGFINSFHAVTLHESPGAFRIGPWEKCFAQVQLVFEKKGWQNVQGGSVFFQDYRVKQYFTDVRRVLLKELNR